MSESFFKNNPTESPSGVVPELTEGENSSRSQESSFKTEEGRMAAILSYIPFLCFIPLLNMRDNKEAYFHARQGMILFLIEVVAVIFMIDFVSDMIFAGVLILALGLSVAGVYFAVQGRNYRLPIIADMAEKAEKHTAEFADNPKDKQE